eukprot:PITA_16559
MPIISFSAHRIICSSQRLLHSLPQYLFFLIATLGCASLFPCSLSLDARYQYCQNNSKCGTAHIHYPFGVGSRGCGHPSFQINCVQNSSFFIPIDGRNYTILMFLPPKLVITRGQNCQFLNDSKNSRIQSLEFAGTVFTFKATVNLTLSVYKCKEQDHLSLTKCNASSSVYYSYKEENSASACSMEQVPVYAVLIHPDAIGIQYESCTSCQASNGICGYNTSVSTAPPPFVCYCNDGPSSDKCPGHDFNININRCTSELEAILLDADMNPSSYGPRNKEDMNSSSNGPRNKAIKIIIGCFIGGAALTAGLFMAYHLKNRKPAPDGVLPRHLSEVEMGNLPIFSYEELRQTTNCFHKENELGIGGFGSVYLGKLWGGRLVAVKRLYQDNSRRLQQFIHEVKIFSTLNHPHVVRLYGCTPLDSPELLLVYEFISNGTLADHLHGDRRNPEGLPWNTRLKIATQTAETLAFLHALDPPILHRDVKTSNILLDENSDIKLCDFGLCRVVPVDASHVTTIPQGTPGYVDPEYYQCYKLTEKSDVYSFGVVLLEIISAKLAMDINRNRGEINLANLAITKIQEGALNELVDPQLEIEVNQEVKIMVTAVAELAFRCVASERDDRPDMEEVVAQLEEIRHSCGS